MFVTENVPALFKKGTLKMAKEDGEMRRVAEATCVIEPFPASLARELGEDIAGHLITDDNAIRDELESIELRLRAGLQRVYARHAPDMDAFAVLEPVSVRDVSVTAIEDKATGRRHLSLSFVLVFSLESREARNFVLDMFGRTLLWSFERLQRDLLDSAAIHEAAAKLGDMGSATLIMPGEDPIEFNAETSAAHREQAKRLREKAKTH